MESEVNFDNCDVYISYIKSAVMSFFFEKPSPPSKATVNIGAIYNPSVRIGDLLKNLSSLDEDKVLLMLKHLADKSKWSLGDGAMSFR